MRKFLLILTHTKILFILFLLLPSLVFASSAKKNTIKIASGDIMTAYYDIALKLCNFFEKANPDLSCEVIATSGSIENIKLLKTQKVDFALTQANIAVDAFGCKGDYYEHAAPSLELRQVLNLYDEVFTIIAKDDDRIKVFADLAGKRITHGIADSGSSVTYKEIKEFYKIGKSVEVEVNPEEYAKKLCSSEIDAVILVIGHPSASVNHIANKCNVEFTTIETEILAKLLKYNKAFKKVTLRKEMYPNIDEDQSTVGVSAILITTESMDGNIINNFTAYFKKHVKSFKQSNHLLENLSDEHFTSEFVLPIHEKLMRKE